MRIFEAYRPVWLLAVMRQTTKLLTTVYRTSVADLIKYISLEGTEYWSVVMKVIFLTILLKLSPVF